MKSFSQRGLVAAGVLSVTGAANAAVPEAVTTAITAVGTDGAVIGAAVLVVLIAIKAFKMLRAAM